jgi:hypothetical protein
MFVNQKASQKREKTMSNKSIHDGIFAELPDFVQGEIKGWRKWQMRRHIAQCSICQKENARLTQLYGQLRTFQSETPPQMSMVPNIAPTTFVLGGKIMNKRMVLAATAALCLLVGGGAIAYKLRPPVMRIGVGELSGKDNRSASGSRTMWYFAGDYQGKVQVFDAKGNPLTNEECVNGSSPTSPLLMRRQKVENMRKAGKILFETTVQGFGKHNLTNVQGQKNGYVILSPMNAKEKQIEDDSIKANINAIVDYHNSIERVTPSHKGASGPKRINGYQLVGAYVDYPVLSLPKELQTEFRKTFGIKVIGGMSWKVYGDVKVKVTSYLPEKSLAIHGWKGKIGPSIVVIEGESKSLPTADAELFSGESKVLERLKRLDLPKPEIYWTIANVSENWSIGENWSIDNVWEKDNADRENGRWKSVKRTGSFTGYGTHEVKDTQGKVLMRIEVSPKPKAITKPAP